MKALKSLELLNKTLFCDTNALKVSNIIRFETKSTLDVFKNCFSSLAANLLKKLSTPPSKYTFIPEMQYHRYLSDSFDLTNTKEIDIEIHLSSTNVHKATRKDELSSRFLKDGLHVLSKPISELCNRFIKSGRFTDSCKILKLKPFFKKVLQGNFSDYKPISLLPLISKGIENIIIEQISSFN